MGVGVGVGVRVGVGVGEGEEEGYVSIGCRPCTRKWLDNLDGRGGRWAGLNKTECGLHTTLGS